MTIAQSILNLIFSFIGTIISVILAPIDLLISTYMPNFDTALGYLSSMLDFITPYIAYIVDLSLIPKPIIILLVSYTIFKITVPLMVYVIKIALKWFTTLKF